MDELQPAPRGAAQVSLGTSGDLDEAWVAADRRPTLVALDDPDRSRGQQRSELFVAGPATMLGCSTLGHISGVDHDSAHHPVVTAVHGDRFQPAPRAIGVAVPIHDRHRRLPQHHRGRERARHGLHIVGMHVIRSALTKQHVRFESQYPSVGRTRISEATLVIEDCHQVIRPFDQRRQTARSNLGPEFNLRCRHSHTSTPTPIFGIKAFPVNPNPMGRGQCPDNVRSQKGPRQGEHAGSTGERSEDHDRGSDITDLASHARGELLRPLLCKRDAICAQLLSAGRPTCEFGWCSRLTGSLCKPVRVARAEVLLLLTRSVLPRANREIT